MPIFLGKIQLWTSAPCLWQAESSPSDLTEDFQLSELFPDEETNRGLESVDTTRTSLEEPRVPEASRLVPPEVNSSWAGKQAPRFTIGVKPTSPC